MTIPGIHYNQTYKTKNKCHVLGGKSNHNASDKFTAGICFFHRVDLFICLWMSKHLVLLNGHFEPLFYRGRLRNVPRFVTQNNRDLTVHIISIYFALFLIHTICLIWPNYPGAEFLGTPFGAVSQHPESCSYRA